MKKLFLLIFIILTLYINTVFAETIKAPNMASYNNDYIELETTDNINYLKYIDPKYKYSILIPKKYDKITNKMKHMMIILLHQKEENVVVL